ncbi:PREDICTED: DNA replication licensing factor REC [Drosophila arizonae]|uniref:DNA replication licensing factor REC n=1 Tax=Drosophila arizonae TaxID=7263 RepID=A0ABM1P4E2_DROAR|nr:PREDICTED: DNA replication licensing factor REC [Drosophila arizonae]
MSPPTNRGASRFVRGKARGGSGYRPYFYFRRNGRVIPAGGNRPAGADHDSTSRGTAQPRGWNRARADDGAGRKRASNAALDCSYLRPENYVAPEDALQVRSLLVDNPRACPGWRLYFMREEYVADSEMAKRIVAVEAHYQRNPLIYNVALIRQSGCFQLSAPVILNDEQLKLVWPTLKEDLQKQPLRTLSTVAMAMHTVVVNNGLDVAADEAADSILPMVTTKDSYVPRRGRTRKIYVRPEDFVPVELISSISHARVDSMFAVRGIVSSVGEPICGLAWQAFRCTRCHTEQSLRQRGTYSPRPYHCMKPLCSAKDNFLALRNSPYTRLSVRQIIRLEETSISLLTDYDNALAGELDIELRHDLVDSVQVGQEIIVTGVLKLRELSDNSEQPSTSAAATTGGDTQAYLRACSVQQAYHIKPEFSERDLKVISMINSEPNNFKLLVQSLAPELHGHEMAKAACLLSLLGEKINVLLVGDPGIGKSKLLQNCAQISERGGFVSGKRGSQAGNQLGINFTGRNKRVMDAGALLTASTAGHCMVDGVDKLASKQTLLLQSMQAGQLNVVLPGAFASYDAQPAIIACANPQRGQYDQSRYLLQNIRITPALLKEFHLVYVLLDRPSKTRDISLTEHVRALHAGSRKRSQIAARFVLKPKKSDSMCEINLNDVPAAQPKDDDDDNDDDSIMQQDYDLDKRLDHSIQEHGELDLLPPILIKKFISYARHHVKPLLNDAATKAIRRHFLELCRRSEVEHEQSQIGMGQLLGLISLSQARARLDLASTVTSLHVRDVIAVVTESMAQTRLGAASGQASAAPSSSSKKSQLQNFVRMMQMRSAALGRSIFEFEELKEMGTRAGIMTGISNLVELANLGGYLLKKGVNMYEVVPD